MSDREVASWLYWHAPARTRGRVPLRVPLLAQCAETGPAHGDLCVFGPCMVVPFLAVATGQADGDVEAAGGDGGGVHSSVVDGGDRRHQGETETEAVMAGAVIEPGERQEQPVDHV